MSNEDKAKRLADRIAEKIQSSETVNSYGAGAWDGLQARLDRMYQDIRAGKSAPALETQSTFTPQVTPPNRSAVISNHPSQEKFNINEAIVDELVEFFEKEKACSFEPNGKPCDHCSMCSSRGF
jgi:hypothetical protein